MKAKINILVYHTNSIGMNKIGGKSPPLKIGDVYTRVQLSEIYKTSDATIRNGVFPVPGTIDVLLFVTEIKDRSQPRYSDRLLGEVLEWDGQMSGRNDDRIILHASKGLNLLLFYRKNKRAFPNGGFVYLGLLKYLSHSGANPSHFLLGLIEVGSKEDDTSNRDFIEGGELHRLCTYYERNKRARAEAIKLHGLKCEICNFDFEAVYGVRGAGYVEVHHVTPLHFTKIKKEVNPHTDLVVLCSNCHRMIHRYRESVPTPPQLKEEMVKQKGKRTLLIDRLESPVGT